VSWGSVIRCAQGICLAGGSVVGSDGQPAGIPLGGCCEQGTQVHYYTRAGPTKPQRMPYCAGSQIRMTSCARVATSVAGHDCFGPVRHGNFRAVLEPLHELTFTQRAGSRWMTSSAREATGAHLCSSIVPVEHGSYFYGRWEMDLFSMCASALVLRAGVDVVSVRTSTVFLIEMPRWLCFVQLICWVCRCDAYIFELIQLPFYLFNLLKFLLEYSCDILLKNRKKFMKKFFVFRLQMLVKMAYNDHSPPTSKTSTLPPIYGNS